MQNNHHFYITTETISFDLVFTSNTSDYIYSDASLIQTHNITESCINKGNNKITELRTILQMESQNS